MSISDRNYYSAGQEIDYIDHKIRSLVDEIRRPPGANIHSTDAEDELLELKTRWNELVPISMLPNEIISEVFLVCARCDVDHSHSCWSWINVSYICKRWRNVALGSPMLWGYLDFLKPALVPEMLRRSQKAPLIVSVPQKHIIKDQVEDAVISALHHIHRVSEITLRNVVTASLGKALSDIRQGAPLLHTLCLTRGETEVATLASSKHPVVLPSDFLNGNAPCLRHVDLHGFHLSWDSDFLKNLTTLKLTYNSPTHAPSLQQLTHVLDRMPGLETLKLWILPLSDTTVTSGFAFAQLLHLREIGLMGDVDGCAILLDHISFPCTARMRFGCVVDSRIEPDVLDKASPMLSSLSRLRSQFSSEFQPQSSIASIDVSASFRNLQITLGRNSVVTTSPSPYWLQLSMHYDTTLHEELTQKVFEALSPLHNVRVLSFTGWIPSLYESFSLGLSNVQTLHVRGTEGLSILDDLLRLTETELKFALFPSLVCLSLVGVAFGPASQLTDLELDRINDMLLERRQMKAGIRELRLANCKGLTREHTERLKDICTDAGVECVE
ncbi:hypothetical protein D9758_007500 [Tetrapyrgos nigripes]|uniref:F-box domain-containing protein n=1 Tax=Tetrapyrgos nigripes TaxID=182062 RepID=A0A8H5G3K1_9AGAR|nr:hypothetical protein D9758_007500 [Tetrapyrgos nigripes]